MLCARLNIVGDSFSGNAPDYSQELETEESSKKTKSKGPDVTLPPPPFFIETKFDGERFQIHYDGTAFKYISRKTHSYTKNFNETLTPRLRAQIKPHVKSFIIDGEMMAWNKEMKHFTRKGKKLDVKKMTLNHSKYCPCFVAYDILYCDGQVLTQTPFKERMQILDTLFVPKADVIQISEKKIISASSPNPLGDVMKLLDDAISMEEEGLVVKEMDSIYLPGQRHVSWLKIKPEVRKIIVLLISVSLYCFVACTL